MAARRPQEVEWVGYQLFCFPSDAVMQIVMEKIGFCRVIFVVVVASDLEKEFPRIQDLNTTQFFKDIAKWFNLKISRRCSTTTSK
nr:hypothetical protein [Tanacetum cinerariifolium]